MAKRVISVTFYVQKEIEIEDEDSVEAENVEQAAIDIESNQLENLGFAVSVESVEDCDA